MRDTVTLLESLRAQPQRYDFFAAVRALECAQPHLPRVGCALREADEALRFAQHVELAFRGGAIEALDWQPGAGKPVLRVNFFGLLGPNGPMPLHITEYVRDRLHHHGDAALARFLDLFNHRMTALFYRARAVADPAICMDRPDQDRFGDYVASLIGIGAPALRGRDVLPDCAKLHAAGLIAAHTRHAAGLAQALREDLGLPVALRQFVGQWLRLPRAGRSRLGAHDGSASLGIGLVLGERVWDCQHKFRIIIGPVGLADYRRLLPIGAGFARLVAWVRNVIGDALDWDLQLVLRRDAMPELALGRDARLGWTTWLRSRPAEQDDAQSIIRPRAAAGAATPEEETP